MGWIGVDFDGTLSQYDKWEGEENLGDPIPKMMERVKRWVSEGKEVKIMTARFNNGPRQVEFIHQWCEKHGLPRLEVTATKDMKMYELWDDRAIQVIPNTGISIDGGE